MSIHLYRIVKAVPIPQGVLDDLCMSYVMRSLCKPLVTSMHVDHAMQTTVDDKESGQVISAVNCYFMCQVRAC